MLYILLTGHLNLVKEIKLICKNSWPSNSVDKEYLTKTKTKRILLKTLSEYVIFVFILFFQMFFVLLSYLFLKRVLLFILQRFSFTLSVLLSSSLSLYAETFDQIKAT